MILSRLPIVWSRLHLLPMRRTVSPLNTQNAALECMIRTPAGPVRFLSLHLAHIGGGGAAGADRLPACPPSPRAARGRAVERHRRRAVAQLDAWRGASRRRRWRRSGWVISTWSRAAPNTGASPADKPYHPGAAYLDGFVDAAVAAGHRHGDLHTHVKAIDGTDPQSPARPLLRVGATCPAGPFRKGRTARRRRTIFRCSSISISKPRRQRRAASAR